MPHGVFQLKAFKWRALDVRGMEQAVYAELDREGDIVKRMYEQTTRTWTHQPTFWKAVGRSMYKAGVRVYTDDPVYGYVDYGTRPHIIRARNARVLRFYSKFSPKTNPRIIGSRRGSVGGNLVFRRQVHHPGTKAREFTAEIQKRRALPFAKNLQAVITKAFLRSMR